MTGSRCAENSDKLSAGELHVAQKSGFPADRIHFLGNNKSREDIDAALNAGSTIVIDGFHEFEMLREVVPEGKRHPVMLRISPGVEPDTHDHISTGQLDSKFGFSVESGAARQAVEQAFVQQPGGEEYRAALFRKLGPLLAKRDVVEIQGWTLSWTTDPTAVPAFNFAAPDEEVLLGRIRVPGDRHSAQATLRSR